MNAPSECLYIVVGRVEGQEGGVSEGRGMTG